MSWSKVNSPEPHRCDLPQGPGQGVKVHDTIRCNECNQHWRCTRIEYGMSYDPVEPYLVYERVAGLPRS